MIATDQARALIQTPSLCSGSRCKIAASSRPLRMREIASGGEIDEVLAETHS
jgi:hypothetical protein